MSDSKPHLRRKELMAFLLGELEDAEQSRIENMFLTPDAALEEELEEAKQELYREYQSGALSPEASRRFEKRFLNEALAEDKEKFRSMLERNTEALERGEEVAPPPKAPVAKSEASDRAASTAPEVQNAPGATRSPLLFVVLALVLAGGVGAFIALQPGDSGETISTVELTGFSKQGMSQVGRVPKSGKVELLLELPSGVSANASAFLLGEGEPLELSLKMQSKETATVVIDLDGIGEGRRDIELRDDSDEPLTYYSFQK